MEEVLAEEAGLAEEEPRQQHQTGAAAGAAAGGFRLAHQMGVAAVAAVAQPRMAVVEEEQLGRWLEAMEVAEAHLLLGRAVGVALRHLAPVVLVVLVERWKLVVEEVLPGSS